MDVAGFAVPWQKASQSRPVVLTSELSSVECRKKSEAHGMMAGSPTNIETVSLCARIPHAAHIVTSSHITNETSLVRSPRLCPSSRRNGSAPILSNAAVPQYQFPTQPYPAPRFCFLIRSPFKWNLRHSAAVMEASRQNAWSENTQGGEEGEANWATWDEAATPAQHRGVGPNRRFGARRANQV